MFGDHCEDGCPVLSCFYNAVLVPDGESLGTLFQTKIMWIFSPSLQISIKIFWYPRCTDISVYPVPKLLNSVHVVCINSPKMWCILNFQVIVLTAEVCNMYYRFNKACCEGLWRHWESHGWRQHKQVRNLLVRQLIQSSFNR